MNYLSLILRHLRRRVGIVYYLYPTAIFKQIHTEQISSVVFTENNFKILNLTSKKPSESGFLTTPNLVPRTFSLLTFEEQQVKQGWIWTKGCLTKMIVSESINGFLRSTQSFHMDFLYAATVWLFSILFHLFHFSDFII